MDPVLAMSRLSDAIAHVDLVQATNFASAAAAVGLFIVSIKALRAWRGQKRADRQSEWALTLTQDLHRLQQALSHSCSLAHDLARHSYSALGRIVAGAERDSSSHQSSRGFDAYRDIWAYFRDREQILTDLKTSTLACESVMTEKDGKRVYELTDKAMKVYLLYSEKIISAFANSAIMENKNLSSSDMELMLSNNIKDAYAEAEKTFSDVFLDVRPLLKKYVQYLK